MTIEELVSRWGKEADMFHEIVKNPERQEMRLPAIAAEDTLRVCIKDLKLVKNNVGLGVVKKCETCELLDNVNNFCKTIDKFVDVRFGCIHHCS